MGNRTNSWDKAIRPSNLARSDPTPERSQQGEPIEKEKAEPHKEARSSVIKVLSGSPQHARKTLAPVQPLPTLANIPNPDSKSEDVPLKPFSTALKGNSKFFGAETEIRPRKARVPGSEAKDSKRGSMGAGSRKSSQTRKSKTPSITLAERNAPITAQARSDAQQSVKAYKAAVCRLFATWNGKPELTTVDSFLALDTDLTHYLGRLFSLAPELDKTQLKLSDLMSCGVHFLWSCRNEVGEDVQLKGTDFEGCEVQYFAHVQSFFNLVSKDLDFANLRHEELEVGKVVDFRDSEFSRNVMATVSMLQQVYDKILDSSMSDLFDDWDS